MQKLLLIAVLGIGTNWSTFAQDAKPPSQHIAAMPELNRILDTERSVFGTLHLAPIPVPEGEQVGDLMDADTAALIARAEDCFEGLNPRKGPSTLPAMTILSEKGLAAALGVGDIAEAKGESKETYSFILDFKDVEVQKVSLVQLRSTLKKNVPECDQLRPFIDASYNSVGASKEKKTATTKPLQTAAITRNMVESGAVAITDKPPPLLLATVFTARRVVRVRTSSIADAQAKLSFAQKQKLMEHLWLGANYDIAAGGGSETSDDIDIESKATVPVAFVPAFFIKRTRQLASGRMEYEVANIDPDDLEVAIKVAREAEDRSLNAIANIFARTPPANTHSINGKYAIVRTIEPVQAKGFHVVAPSNFDASKNNCAGEDCVLVLNKATWEMQPVAKSTMLVQKLKDVESTSRASEAQTIKGVLGVSAPVAGAL